MKTNRWLPLLPIPKRTPTKFHLWPLLPTELKREVLSYHVSHDVDIDHSAHDAYMKDGIMSKIISARNQELFMLSLDLYYTINRFLVEIDWWSFTETLSYSPLAYAPMIRTLLVKLYPLKIHETLKPLSILNKPTAWRFFLQPTAHPREGSKAGVAWQGHFSNLRSLIVKLYFEQQRGYHGVCLQCGWRPDELEALREWLGKRQLNLKADKAEVTIKNKYHWRVDWLPCDCEVSTEELVEKMALRQSSRSNTPASGRKGANCNRDIVGFDRAAR